MRVFLQSSNLNHLANMAESMELRGDTVHTAASLAELQALASSHHPDGMVMDLSPEGIAWWQNYQMEVPGARTVFLTPRENLSQAIQQNPGLSLLPMPGTAMAIRCQLSPNPAEDPACALGDYQLCELDALGRRTHIFRALQRSINRPVTLRLLNQELELDQEAVAEFLDDVRAKAAVTHDRVGTVYQALEDHGSIFYTAEAVDGTSLGDLTGPDRKLGARQILEIARTLVSALAHLESRQLACASIEARHIHLTGSQKIPRLANQATRGKFAIGHHASLLQHSLSTILPLLDPADPDAAAVSTFLHDIIQTPTGKLGFTELSARIRDLATDLETPANPSSGDTAAPAKSPRTLVAMVVGIALVATVGLLLMANGSKSPPQRMVADPESVVAIAGGQFNHPMRGPIDLPPYSIDKYEVTIRQYEVFLEAVAAAAPGTYDHPGQAGQYKEKTSHKPKDWDIWYPIAVAGGKYDGHRLTLDCPVFNVDWWDAHAYARWKNRRLPSEIEWEFAAGGKDWQKYPWGNTWVAANTNGADKPAPLDGHDRWCPVDLPEADHSPDGTHGLAGNVTEWTGSEQVHPEFPDRMIPVAKGGSFVTNGEIDAGKSVMVMTRKEQKPWLGFRTAANLSKP